MNQAKKTIRRKFTSIKKDFKSEEESKQREAFAKKKYGAMRANVSNLKVDTAWNTDAGESSNNYKYHQIHISKSAFVHDSKAEGILSFLDDMKIHQIDFSGMLSCTQLNKTKSKFGEMMKRSANKQNQGSSLLSRRMNRVNKLSCKQD